VWMHPRLKAIVDRLEKDDRRRRVALYVGTYAVAAMLNWRSNNPA